MGKKGPTAIPITKRVERRRKRDQGDDYRPAPGSLPERQDVRAGSSAKLGGTIVQGGAPRPPKRKTSSTGKLTTGSLRKKLGSRS